MKDGLKILIFALCLAGCVGLALTMSIIVIISWAGGPEGMVNLTTNLFHERLAETILFPVWTLMGFIVRERKYFWASRPGRELALATAGAVVVFSLLGMYGLIIPALTVYQVLFVLGYSALFTLAIDFPKYEAFKKFGL